MELPRRDDDDRLLPAGEATDIRRRLRVKAASHDLASVALCAFDHRTRMLPFIYADLRMAPAGIRAIGSALADSGFEKTRLVLQQWNPNVHAGRVRLDGRLPDMLLISSMGLHIDRARRMLRQACAIDPAHRPLIVAGGPSCVYAPWDLFSPDDADPWRADIAVTGEDYVFLAMLEAVLDTRAPGEPLRAAFMRAKASGALDAVPGLVYPVGPDGRAPEALVDTGIQRLCGDLDELPDPTLGYSLLEPPSRRRDLSGAPIPANSVHKHTPIGSLAMTFGCRFSCGYCPIPAYNQRTYRAKSGPRIAKEMSQLASQYGIKYFFGADDNFFNDPPRSLAIIEAIAATTGTWGKKLGRTVRWATEVTVHDVLTMKDHLAVAHKAGLRALWMGVEDMTGTLVKKGQTVDKTIEAFRLLRSHGICPMPMMMHHDDQPLWTRTGAGGLLNQVGLLKKAGGVAMQVLMITPSAGSKLYVDTFTSGMVLESVGSRQVQPHMYDGNYVIASTARRPWRKQYNLMIAYLSFYNPLRLIWTLLWRKDRLGFKPAGVQFIGIGGLLQTVRRTFTWGLRLAMCKITRLKAPLASPIPMRAPDGARAAHDISQ
ncbi:MAG: radical SAM protein [Planctomycetaceae bacterium]|nr:radical SAM protein [Planctomycetaceae bacterium]